MNEHVGAHRSYHEDGECHYSTTQRFNVGHSVGGVYIHLGCANKPCLENGKR